MAKSIRRLAIVTMLGATLGAGAAHAQFALSSVVSVDENANGTIAIGNNLPVPLQVGLPPDPGPSGHASALTYFLFVQDVFLGQAVVPGDVLLTESDGTIGDDIRFNLDPNAGSTLVFYSSDADGSGSLADVTALPATLYDNNITLSEVGLDCTTCAGGISYTPAAGQPGYVAGAQVTYLIRSDVPEPAGLAVLATAAAVLGATRRRRRA